MEKKATNVEEKEIDLSRVRKPVRKNIYGKAYLDILENMVFKISNMAKFVYIYLDARQGTNGFIYEKQENLAKKINISVRSLGTYLKELDSIGAITRIQLHYNKDQPRRGEKFLDVIIPKEYDPFNLIFRDIENLDEIKKDILKALPFCDVASKGKRRSTTVDNVDSVDNSKNEYNLKNLESAENTSVTGSSDTKRKICSLYGSETKRKFCMYTKSKICRWSLPTNGLKPSETKRKICRAELEKDININKRKIDNTKKAKNYPSDLSSNSNFDIMKSWVKACAYIQGTITDVSYKTWIEPLIPIDMSVNTFMLASKDSFSMGIVKDRYTDTVVNALKLVNKNIEKIDIQVNTP
jgi:hypothetical protein